MSSSADQLFPVDLEEMIGEARRELHMRKQVYPHQVRTGRLNPRMAARQIDRMAAILDLLISLRGGTPVARRIAA